MAKHALWWRRELPLAAAAFIPPLVVYTATASRGLAWGDSAEFVSVAHTLGIAHPPGYPLYTLLSAIAVRVPLGTPFLRMSILSGFFAALAAAAAALVVWFATDVPGFGGALYRWRGAGDRAGERSSAAARAAGALLAGWGAAFGRTLWSQSVVPEVYSLSALLVLTALLFTTLWLREVQADRSGRVRFRRHWTVPAIGLTMGLGLAHHLTAVLLVPGILYALFRRRPRPSASSLLAGLLLVALGLSLYAYLPLRAADDPPVLWAPLNSWSQVAEHISGAQYAPRLFTTPVVEVVAKLETLASGLPAEVTWLSLAFALAGLVALARKRPAFCAAVGFWSLLVIAHATVYRIPDIGPYYIPVHAVVAMAAGCGLAALASPPVGSRARRAFATLAVALAVALPAVQLRAHWSVNDMSRRTGGDAYVARLLDSIEPGGVVLTMTDRLLFPLWYARHVEPVRDDFAVLCVREHAPHLKRWYPDVRFPSEGELCSQFEEPPAPPGVPALDSVPIGNYLPLLVAMNVGERHVYADPDLGRRLFLDSTLPRGILVEVVAAPVDSVPSEVEAEHNAFWENVLGGFARGRGDDTGTAEVYAKTLAEHGMLLIERGETAKAVYALERACALAPRVPLCHNNLGVAYDRAGRPEDSAREFRAALELAPALAAPHYNIYRLADRDGEKEQALEALERAVELAPRNPSYMIELGRQLEERAEYERAEQMFTGAVALNEDDWGARLAYGGFLQRRRRFADAVAAYRFAEELRPGSAGALRGLGRCYWALDDREQALEVMERLVELQPHNPQPKYDLALMLHRSGRSRRALGLLDDVIRLLPGMWEARALKASILGTQGRIWEARAMFEQAREVGATGEGFWRTWISMEEAAGDSGRTAEVRGMAAAEALERAAGADSAGVAG